MSEDLLSSFLSKLGAGSKPTVYLSVTPNIGLEICQVDIQSKSIKSYAYRRLAYNETARDILDYEKFKEAVKELFEELNINPKCNVVVNIPVVSLGTLNFPLFIEDNGIKTGIVSEIEQTYIFRRLEPLVAWQNAYSATQTGDNRRVLYSAVQQLLVDSIRDSLASLGATLVDIQLSLTSYLRALDFAGCTSTQMDDANMQWNLLIISATGYSLTSLVGKNIVDYYEEPIAFKTYEGEEIYNEISTSAQITLMSYPANYLYVISETDQVSAELLTNKLRSVITTNIDFYENNAYRKNEILPTSLDVVQEKGLMISLAAVGCALTNTWEYPLKFNFLNDTPKSTGSVDFDEAVLFNIGNTSFEISPKVALKISSVAFLVVVIFFGLLSLVLLPKIESAQQQKLDDINVKLQEIETQLKKYEGNESADTGFEIKKEVKNVIASNRSKLMNYVALGEAIPDSVWITYFMTQDNGLVDVKGSASNVEDIYVFFKNLKDSLINTKLRLQKLEMQSGSSLDTLISSPGSTNYEFEITNMEESQLSAMLNGGNPDENNPNANKSNENKSDNNKSASPLKSTKDAKKGFDNGLLGDSPVDIN